MEYATLMCVVADLTVVFAVEFLTSTVGSGCNGGLFGTPLDLGDMKMEQGQLPVRLLASGIAY